MTRLTEPVGYGFTDAAPASAPRMRLYYPSAESGVRDAPPLEPDSQRAGYPLVLFVHGFRSETESLCPSGIGTDYTRWDTVLPLLPRCGFVVASVAVAAVLTTQDPTAAAAASVRAMAWARGEWQHGEIIRARHVVALPDRPPPLPDVGAIGHSWGARVVARLAAERRVRCVAGVCGSSVRADLVAARVPTLLIGGAEDFQVNSMPTNQPFCDLSPPVHQATLKGIAHWDLSEIAPCNTSPPVEARGSRLIAAELLTMFMHRYVYNDSRLTPSLIGPRGARPDFRPFLTTGGSCAVALRWRDPFTDNARLREVVFGSWPRPRMLWEDCSP